MGTSLLCLMILLSSVLSMAPAHTTPFIQCLSTAIAPRKELPDVVHSPETANYTSILQTYIRNSRFNTSSARRPAAIVTPSRVSHVCAAVRCARKSGTQLKIRSGGHDYEELSYTSRSDSPPFAILDTYRFNLVEINLESETAWVGAGATLGELYYRIWESSKEHAFPSGVCPTIGVGGHVSGGGYGNLMRKFGLSVDNVVDEKIVDARGRVLDRKGMGEDVFWAIQGGGGASFGILLAFKIRLVRVPPVVTVFEVPRTLEENATALLYRWQYIAPNADRDLFLRAFLRPATINGRKTANATFIAMYLGGADNLTSLLNSTFPELRLTRPDFHETTWIKSVLFWYYGPPGLTTPETALLERKTSQPTAFKMKSDYVKNPIPKHGLGRALEKIAEWGDLSFMFNPYGGLLEEIPEAATAFPHLAGNLYKIQYLLNWAEAGPVVEKSKIERMREFHEYMTPYVSKDPREAFLNYRDLDIGSTDNSGDLVGKARVYGVKYFKGNFERLVRVKTEFDPDNFFRYEQSIPPLTNRTGSS